MAALHANERVVGARPLSRQFDGDSGRFVISPSVVESQTRLDSSTHGCLSEPNRRSFLSSNREPSWTAIHVLVANVLDKVDAVIEPNAPRAGPQTVPPPNRYENPHPTPSLDSPPIPIIYIHSKPLRNPQRRVDTAGWTRASRNLVEPPVDPTQYRGRESPRLAIHTSPRPAFRSVIGSCCWAREPRPWSCSSARRASCCSSPSTRGIARSARVPWCRRSWWPPRVRP